MSVIKRLKALSSYNSGSTFSIPDYSLVLTSITRQITASVTINHDRALGLDHDDAKNSYFTKHRESVSHRFSRVLS